MSAAIFGANLLEEVQEESLDQLFLDLRRNLDPEPRCLLGIPELDHLLNLFLYPHGTNPEAGSDDSPSPGHNDPGNQPKPKPETCIIEIGNSASGTGKTNLLYHITAASILPKLHKGKEAAVVWLDADISFSATRLDRICINLLSQKSPSLNASEAQAISQDALKHVHVFSISSSKQLLSSLNGLETYLLNLEGQSNHQSLHRPLSLVILDSATAFHYPDRFDSEIARLEATQPPSSVIQTATQILTALKSILSRFDAMGIYTTHSHHYHPPSQNMHDDQSTPILPWSLNATLSLKLSRIQVPQFASHMTLDECLRDRAKRQDVVRLNRVRVAVNEQWLGTVVRGRVKGKEVRDAVRRMDGRGAFVIRIGESGVVIE